MNMKNFSIGDKVVLTKSFERYSKVGEVYEIGNIVENGFIIRGVHSKLAIGLIKFHDFFSCFEKQEDKKWTDWSLAHYDGESDNDADVLINYRTNGKRVEVKAYGCKGVASCMPDDDFNLSKGIYIAFLRCKSAFLLKKRVDLMKEVNNTYSEMKKNYNDLAKATN